MSTTSIPTLSKFTPTTSSTIDLYDSLFQILSILSSQQPHELPFDTMTKYNLLIKSASEADDEILEEIEQKLIYTQTYFEGSLQLINELLEAISGIKKLNSLCSKTRVDLFLSSANSSRSSLCLDLEFDEDNEEEEEEEVDFDSLYSEVNYSLMRIKVELVNWDTETEVEEQFIEDKLADFIHPPGMEMFDFDLEE